MRMNYDLPPKLDQARPARRRAVNVSLPEALVAAARELDLNISAVAEEGLRTAVRRARERAWGEENRLAIEANNRWVEENGLPLRPAWPD